jgi:hypothetical protein
MPHSRQSANPWSAQGRLQHSGLSDSSEGNKAESPTVVFIASTNRSGSTLLGDALGQMSGCFHGGELSFVLGQFDGDNHICGCGKSIDACAQRPDEPPRWCPRICGCGHPLRECDFWRSVQLQAFGSGYPSADLAELGRFSVEGMRYSPRSLLKLRREVGLSNLSQSPSIRYAEALRHIYFAIAGATGAEVIVDSSKRAMHTFIGARLAGMRAHIIHLVRDPRAIAYSWPRRNTDAIILGPVRVSMNWVVSNFAAETFRQPDTSYTLVRYEDFIRNPKPTLAKLGERIGIQDPFLPFVDAMTLHMAANHTVAGSPSRFRTGDVKLAPDDEWRIRMSARDRTLATLLAAPFLKRYGYPFRSR